MEKSDVKCGKQKKDRRHRIGLIFLIIGLVLLGRNLNFFPVHVIPYLFSWQMLLIGIGFAMFIMNRRNFGGLALMIIGSLFLWDKISPLTMSQWEIAWPGVFIFIGLVLIFGYLGNAFGQDKSKTEKPKRKSKYDDIEFDIDKIKPIED
jgi:predicted membrane protein